MRRRLDKLREVMTSRDIDAVLITNGYNSMYMSCFTGSSCYLFVSKTQQVLLTDFRYIEQAHTECPNFEIIDYLKKGLEVTLSELCIANEVKVMGLEEHLMTHREYKFICEHLEGTNIEDIEGVIEKIRWIKDENELAKIKASAAIADSAFEHIIPFLRAGISEWEIAIELEYQMKSHGATALSFPSIVASGKRSSLPHGRASNKELENGDFVILDFGCIFEGYCSDMTRTVVIGKADEKQKEVYNTVLDAQLKALDVIKAGVSGVDVDGAARELIDSTAYKGCFGHSLGHGVGLNVHETPTLSTKSYGLLKNNMVVTIEPGIYIPDYGGVRIEDLVIITEEGHINLTHSTKKLLEL